MSELLILVVAGLFLAAPIVAIVALVRTRKIAELQQQIWNLEERVSRLRHAPPADPGRAPAPEAPPPETTPSRPVAPPPSRPAASPPSRPATPPPSRPAASPITPAPAGPGPGFPAPPLTPPPPPIDWERWIGLRGAAVLGAVALGLAGLLFFKYSIEHGLVTPVMRVVIGTITGLACLVGAEWLRSREYRMTAEGVSGGGVVVLYAAFWASHVLYGLIPMVVAFTLMALVTVTCCLLALKNDSQIVAVIGLVGGFATPLLLSSGADRPFGLFGYVLLLDLAILFVAQRRRWPSLGILSLMATVLIQALWIGARMGPDRLALGLIILGVFAALFVFAIRFIAGPDPIAAWQKSQIGAILFPFAFALYFAARVDLGPHLYPIGILLALLGAGAGWVARGAGARAIGPGAAVASVTIVGIWLLRHPLTVALAWETVAVAAGLALVFHLFVEIDRASIGMESPAAAAMIAAGGLFVLLLMSAARFAPPWPWIAGWTAIAALLYRHAAFPSRGVLQIGAAAGLGLGLSIVHLSMKRSPDVPPPPIVLAILVGSGIVAQAVAMVRKDRGVRDLAQHAAAGLAVVLLGGLAISPMTPMLNPVEGPGVALILGLLAMVAATRLGEGAWLAAAVGATAIVQISWTWGRAGLRDRPVEMLAALFVLAIAVVVFTAWPLLAVRRFAGGRWGWYAAALAGPIWFPALRRLFVWRFGDQFIGALPIALAVLALVAARSARRQLGPADPARLRALAWFAAVSLCFVAVAIPLQLSKEWITIGWALQGLAVIALWTRLDHPGLKYFGLALLAAATVRLIANPAILGYHQRSSIRIFNWLLYTYLVPAAALIGSAALLKSREVARARGWEDRIYAGGHAAGAAGAGFAAIALIFVWINLSIADWFSTGPVLRLSFGDLPAQRLTVSIVWAIYALILLGIGMYRDAIALRWISLCFLLVTIGKVFLYDLGALQDLYRVASLVGLAVSLILVSLLYQRFVFRARQEGK